LGINAHNGKKRKKEDKNKCLTHIYKHVHAAKISFIILYRAGCL
jgi:hypothetical protein